jgi:hypothetical protein
MIVSTVSKPTSAIFYPESNGLPMAENTLQFQWIFVLAGNLSALFHDRKDVFVCGNQFWYPVEGEPEIRLAPDVYVVFGRPKGHRPSYKQWEEGGIPMTVVWDILSPGNDPLELVDKLTFYEDYGVEDTTSTISTPIAWSARACPEAAQESIQFPRQMSLLMKLSAWAPVIAGANRCAICVRLIRAYFCNRVLRALRARFGMLGTRAHRRAPFRTVPDHRRPPFRTVGWPAGPAEFWRIMRTPRTFSARILGGVANCSDTIALWRSMSISSTELLKRRARNRKRKARAWAHSPHMYIIRQVAGARCAPQKKSRNNC